MKSNRNVPLIFDFKVGPKQANMYFYSYSIYLSEYEMIENALSLNDHKCN